MKDSIFPGGSKLWLKRLFISQEVDTFQEVNKIYYQISLSRSLGLKRKIRPSCLIFKGLLFSPIASLKKLQRQYIQVIGNTVKLVWCKPSYGLGSEGNSPRGVCIVHYWQESCHLTQTGPVLHVDNHNKLHSPRYRCLSPTHLSRSPSLPWFHYNTLCWLRQLGFWAIFQLWW